MLSLFSAPQFMSTNHNSAAVARLVTRALSPAAIMIERFDAVAGRAVQLPGAHRNAFSWSAAALWGAACDTVVQMLRDDVGGAVSAPDVDASDETESLCRGFRSRMELLMKIMHRSGDGAQILKAMHEEVRCE
jgi:hypothetical protein